MVPARRRANSPTAIKMAAPSKRVMRDLISGVYSRERSEESAESMTDEATTSLRSAGNHCVGQSSSLRSAWRSPPGDLSEVSGITSGRLLWPVLEIRVSGDSAVPPQRGTQERSPVGIRHCPATVMPFGDESGRLPSGRFGTPSEEGWPPRGTTFSSSTTRRFSCEKACWPDVGPDAAGGIMRR